MLQGIGVSRGIAQAEAFVVTSGIPAIEKQRVEDTQEQIDRFRAAQARVADNLRSLCDKAEALGRTEQREIFDAQLSILTDQYSLVDPIVDYMRAERCDAAYAAEHCVGGIVAAFERMDDAYMRARAADARDIRRQLLEELLGVRRVLPRDPSRPVVVVAYELTPSDTARLGGYNVQGFATEIGGETSHTAIIARAGGIPAVVGVAGLTAGVAAGDLVLLDGGTGEVIVRPTEAQCSAFSERRDALERERQSLLTLRDRPTATGDGTPILLAGNIGSPEDVRGILENGAEGIGLFRSEFLYLSRQDLPDEQEQFEAYRRVVQEMRGKPVIIRTLDVGGDKNLPGISSNDEENPFLGLRAIRLCLQYERLFLTQLRALLRAAAYGEVHIMFPMISGVEELRRAKGMLEKARLELEAEGITCPARVPVGVMIEVPAAAMVADRLAQEADFFSIGTNDLIQYTLAADRGNRHVQYLYSPFHPAVLRLIHRTGRAAAARGIPCGMCGEAAAETALLPFWVGAGLGELSVSAGSILPVRRALTELDRSACEELAERLIELGTEEEVRRALEQWRRERLPGTGAPEHGGGDESEGI